MRGSFGGGFSFAQVPQADIPRSVFNRSHGYKTTFNAGELIPFYVDEALPGDTFNVRVSLFARLATPLAPLMDNLHMECFFFSVPNRLLWDNWPKFMGERLSPGDSIDFRVPHIDAPAGGFTELSIYDYMGIPTQCEGIEISALPLRAYYQIWNEWFRDENIQTRRAVDTDDGPDLSTDYGIRKRGKRHDYFTSCLPWPQKQTDPVTLPLGTTAPLTIALTPDAVNPPTFKSGANIRNLYMTNGQANATWQNNPTVSGNALWDNPRITATGTADLTGATAQTINAIREAFQVQRLLERDARGGTRYIELLRAHFGVVSPDQRLQRPEYLGGGSVPISINPVVQTSQTTSGADASPQGNLAAYGVGGGQVGFSKSFVEHCTLIGLVMVRADLNYQQGLNKMWSRRTRYDYYWPAFAHLGEQAVLLQELYCSADGTGNDTVFGYQERWAEYRYFPSIVTGQFRSNASASYDLWHLAQQFGAAPALNSGFIEEDPPISRIIAVSGEPAFLLDSHFAIKAVRPMPTYSVPGLVDHF